MNDKKSKFYQTLFDKMLKQGQSKRFKYSFIPFGVLNDDVDEFSEASDYFYKKYDATHFNCYIENDDWILVLGQGDSFGACLDIKEIHKEVIPITNFK